VRALIEYLNAETRLFVPHY